MSGLEEYSVPVSVRFCEDPPPGSDETTHKQVYAQLDDFVCSVLFSPSGTSGRNGSSISSGFKCRNGDMYFCEKVWLGAERLPGSSPDPFSGIRDIIVGGITHYFPQARDIRRIDVTRRYGERSVNTLFVVNGPRSSRWLFVFYYNPPAGRDVADHELSVWLLAKYPLSPDEPESISNLCNRVDLVGMDDIAEARAAKNQMSSHSNRALHDAEFPYIFADKLDHLRTEAEEDTWNPTMFTAGSSEVYVLSSDGQRTEDAMLENVPTDLLVERIQHFARRGVKVILGSGFKRYYDEIDFFFQKADSNDVLIFDLIQDGITHFFPDAVEVGPLSRITMKWRGDVKLGDDTYPTEFYATDSTGLLWILVFYLYKAEPSMASGSTPRDGGYSVVSLITKFPVFLLDGEDRKTACDRLHERVYEGAVAKTLRRVDTTRIDIAAKARELDMANRPGARLYAGYTISDSLNLIRTPEEEDTWTVSEFQCGHEQFMRFIIRFPPPDDRLAVITGCHSHWKLWEFLQHKGRSIQPNRDNDEFRTGDPTFPWLIEGDLKGDPGLRKRIAFTYENRELVLREQFSSGQELFMTRPESNRSLHGNASGNGRGDLTTCSICMDPLERRHGDPDYSVLPCGHTFHSTCMHEVISHMAATCPACRLPLQRNTLRQIQMEYDMVRRYEANARAARPESPRLTRRNQVILHTIRQMKAEQALACPARRAMSVLT